VTFSSAFPGCISGIISLKFFVFVYVTPYLQPRVLTVPHTCTETAYLSRFVLHCTTMLFIVYVG